VGLKPRIPDGPHKVVVKREGGKFVADCPYRKCKSKRSHGDRAQVLALMAVHLRTTHDDGSALL
jgi:hypothetical protein